MSDARQITNDPSLEFTPALSPRGDLIAYSAGSPRETAVFVRQLDGGHPLRIGTGRGPRWYPDGSRLVFVTDEGLVSAPALGGSIRVLVPHSDSGRVYAPAISNSGEWLAFARTDGTIHLASVDGSYSRQLTRVTDPHSIAWSPDDSRLAYVSGNPFFVWSVDGFANIAPSSIWILQRTGGQPRRIAGPAGLNMSPAWMPDGSALLYVSDGGGSRDIYYQPLRRDGSRAASPQRLTSGLGVHGIDLSRDGGQLAYSSLMTSSGIWSMPVPASGQASLEDAQQITAANEMIEAVAVSADGQWLVFDSNRSGKSKIYKMRTDGTGLQQLTTGIGGDFYASWSPDGSRLAFHSWRNGTRDLYIANANGTGERLRVGGPLHAWAGAFSPDGRWLAFVGQSVKGGGPESLRLFVAATDSGPARQVTEEQALLSTPLWTANGEILYATPEGLRVTSASGRTRGLRLPGGPGEYRPHWIGGLNADSTAAYIRVRSRGDEGFHIARVPLDGSPGSIVVRFDRHDRQTLRSEFGTDGRKFYFIVGQHHADIWVMQLSNVRTPKKP